MSAIVVQKGLFESASWIKQIAPLANHFAIITDQHVATLYGEKLKAKMEEEGKRVLLIAIKPGERSKNRKQKEKIEDCLQENYFGRDSLLIALGGGVVTDLTGFVAATYCRGIPYISIPTTLLAMIDASIGGKVGVNTPYGKNLIGTYHLPHMLLIDTKFLETLPQVEMLNGQAEIVKYGLIADPSLIEEEISDGLIQKAIAIKLDVVKKDPQEKGLRRILNFGHTIGHAIECASNYRLSHGRAIALGMLLEAKISDLSQKDITFIQQILEEKGFTFDKKPRMDCKKIIEIMNRDKKALSGLPRMVVLEKIGKVDPCDGEYCKGILTHKFEEALQEYGFS